MSEKSEGQKCPDCGGTGGYQPAYVSGGEICGPDACHTCDGTGEVAAPPPPAGQQGSEIHPHCREEVCAVCGAQATIKWEEPGTGVFGRALQRRVHPRTWYLCEAHHSSARRNGRLPPPPAGQQGASEAKASHLFKVGDAVEAIPPFVLACGSGRYDYATVVSLTPFVLSSPQGDMLWESTVTPDKVQRIGTATWHDLYAGIGRYASDKKFVDKDGWTRVAPPAAAPAASEAERGAMPEETLTELERLDGIFNAWHGPGDDRPDLLKVRKELFAILYRAMPELIADSRALAAAESARREAERERDEAKRITKIQMASKDKAVLLLSDLQSRLSAAEQSAAALREALTEAVSVIEGLADQQAMPDDFYQEPLERIKRAALERMPGNPGRAANTRS